MRFEKQCRGAREPTPIHTCMNAASTVRRSLGSKPMSGEKIQA